MSNVYGTLEDVKRLLGTTATTHDVLHMNHLESASRVIDNFTGRHFFVNNTTKYYATNGRLRQHVFDDDVLVVTTLSADSEGDWTHDGETWVEGTDFVMQPDDKFPKGWFLIHPEGNYSLVANKARYFKLIGQFGYGDGERANPVGRVVATITVASGSVLTATLSAESSIEPGNTLLLESEQVYVSAVSGTTLTIERGVNGTTGATHAALTAIDVFEYPMDIRMACANIAKAAFERGRTAGLKSELIGAYQYVVETAKEDGDKLLRMVGPYRAPWAVI